MAILPIWEPPADPTPNGTHYSRANDVKQRKFNAAEYLNVIADVVHVACRAEHHDASLFVLDYDVDQPVTDVLSPTQVRASLASGSIETKDGTLI